MRRWASTLLLFLAAAVTSQAEEFELNQKDSLRCSGMYGRSAWGGSIDPFIDIKFMGEPASEQNKDKDPIVSLVVFEWKDYQLIGRKPAEQEPLQDITYICDDEAVNKKYCNETHKGEFIVAENADKDSHMYIRTQAIHLKNSDFIHYPVTAGDAGKQMKIKTGYYCVWTRALDAAQEYRAVVEFRNAYGELPAAEIAKLPFYGGLTILYALVCVFWGFLYFQHRRDILPVQNYITAILGFLVVEMLMTWGYYDYRNRHGGNIGTKALMIIVSVLNAARNSFSFFLLLIVCMGYGVVKPSLGKTMTIVRWLAVAHFVFGVVYAIASLSVRPDDAGPLVLLVILPLSATLTAFYIWTLNSLGATMKDLMERKQNVKAAMYKRLWWCILTSIIVIFGFFFLNSFSFAGVGDPNFAPRHWQTRWFVLDGWLNIVYLVDVCFIAYLWRPTANNKRFAMSDELAQDDEGFEIASNRSSFDEEEGGGDAQERPYDPMRTGASARANRGASPLPAPQAQRPVVPPRESLDGDTIFAVGEDDKWSDDEDEAPGPAKHDERRRLTGKND